jgi:hypothetical protein
MTLGRALLCPGPFTGGSPAPLRRRLRGASLIVAGLLLAIAPLGILLPAPSWSRGIYEAGDLDDAAAAVSAQAARLEPELTVEPDPGPVARRVSRETLALPGVGFSVSQTRSPPAPALSVAP